MKFCLRRRKKESRGERGKSKREKKGGRGGERRGEEGSIRQQDLSQCKSTIGRGKNSLTLKDIIGCTVAIRIQILYIAFTIRHF
jgi:hypothetical protein